MTFGMIVFPKNMALGISYGMMMGMFIGMVIGSEKDKKLSENMMEISKMENVAETSEVLIYALDKNGVEKEYKVSKKILKQEKFAVGDRAAEEKNGDLVSLESK